MGEDTRHTVRRLSFSWDREPAKPAETNWQRRELLHDADGRTYALVELHPKTGRTHQLRVQLLDHGTPIIGDSMYSSKESREASEHVGLHRQFLHATSLAFFDPNRGVRITITSKLCTDLRQTLAILAERH